MLSFLDRSRYSSRIPTFASWCLVFGIALLVSGVTPLDTLKFVAVSTVVGFSGLSLSARLTPRASELSGLALGIVMALPLWTVLDQTLRNSDFRGSALPMLAAIGVVARWSVPLHETASSPHQGEPVWDAARTPLLVGLLAILLLGQTWIWLQYPVIIAALLLLTVSFNSIPRSRALTAPRLTIVLCGALFVLVAFAVLERPDDWWLPGYGLDELEYLSHAAFTFGSSMDVLAAGIPISYQWLNFATLGLLENAVAVDDFVVVTQFEFVAAAFLTAMLVWGLMVEVLGPSKSSYAAAGVSCLLATAMFYPNAYSLFSLNHHSFAAAYLAAIPLSLVLWSRSHFTWLTLLPAACCIHSILAVKTAVAVPLAAALATSAALFALRRNWKAFIQLAVLGLSLALHLSFSIKSSSGVSIEINEPFKFVGQFATPTWGPKRSALLGAALLVALSGLVGLVLLRWLSNPQRRFIGIVGSTMLCSGLFFAIFSTRVSNTHLHLLQMSVVILMPFTVIEALESSTARWVFSSPLRAVLNIGPAIIASVAIPLLAFPGSPFEISLGWAISTGFGERLAVIGSVAFCVLLAGAFAISAATRLRFRHIGMSGLILLTTITFSVTTGFANAQLLSRMGLMNSGVAEGQLGTSDLRLATQWIDENADTFDIVATNALFSTPEYRDTCAYTAQEQSTTLVEKAENYHPPVVFAKRRFVAIIPAYASITSGRNLDDRVRASLLFACNPSDTNRAALLAFGARWYLAYLPNRPKIFAPPDTVRFTAGDYAVVELTANQ